MREEEEGAGLDIPLRVAHVERVDNDFQRLERLSVLRDNGEGVENPEVLM